MVVRFPAGPRVRLKTVDPPKGNGLGQKKDTTKWQGLFLVTNHVRGDKEEAFFWSLQRKKKQMCKNEPFQFKILVAALAGQISFSLK